MSQRKVSFAPNEYYHIYNRGNSKQNIFKDDFDRRRFQQLLHIANSTKSFDFRAAKRDDVFNFEKGQNIVHVGLYCLMPNHFHLLLKPAEENGIQKFMQKLSTGYSMYFNKKHDRTELTPTKWTGNKNLSTFCVDAIIYTPWQK